MKLNEQEEKILNLLNKCIKDRKETEPQYNPMSDFSNSSKDSRIFYKGYNYNLEHFNELYYEICRYKIEFNSEKSIPISKIDQDNKEIGSKIFELIDENTTHSDLKKFKEKFKDLNNLVEINSFIEIPIDCEKEISDNNIFKLTNGKLIFFIKNTSFSNNDYFYFIIFRTMGLLLIFNFYDVPNFIKSNLLNLKLKEYFNTIYRDKNKTLIEKIDPIYITKTKPNFSQISKISNFLGDTYMNESSMDNFSNKLNWSLFYFFKGFSSEFERDKILFYFICIETVLISEKDTSKKNEKIKSRVCEYLNEPNLKEKIKKLYSIRSELSHSGKINRSFQIEQISKELELMCQKLLRKIFDSKDYKLKYKDFIMGIKVEFNPDLALREYAEFERGNRLEEECVPKQIEINKKYKFLKKGQRNYYLEEDELVPLVTTIGNQQISKPIAKIQILEVTHFLKNGEIWSRGEYIVKEFL